MNYMPSHKFEAELLPPKRRRGRPRKDGSNEESTDLPIIYQMHKTVELGGFYETVFLNGDRAKIDPKIAGMVLAKNAERESSIEKEYFQQALASSFQSFKETVEGEM